MVGVKPSPSSSWLGRWFKRDASAPTNGAPVKANLGEEVSLVYDPETKRWVSRKVSFSLSFQAGDAYLTDHALSPPISLVRRPPQALPTHHRLRQLEHKQRHRPARCAHQRLMELSHPHHPSIEACPI